MARAARECRLPARIHPVFHRPLPFDPPGDAAAWHGWVAQPSIRVALLAAFVALLVHAWVGLRDVMLDYIDPVGLRAPALALVAGALIGIGLWMLTVLASLP